MNLRLRSSEGVQGSICQEQSAARRRPTHTHKGNNTQSVLHVETPSKGKYWGQGGGQGEKFSDHPSDLAPSFSSFLRWRR